MCIRDRYDTPHITYHLEKTVTSSGHSVSYLDEEGEHHTETSYEENKFQSDKVSITCESVSN